jgi:type IV fimbrial biogenesis protein FimT
VLKFNRGITFVEIIIAMAILGILLGLALPSFKEWIRNTKIRTVAESVQNGLQLARAEAVRRNAVVRFQLVDMADNTCALSTTGPHWVVSLDSVVGKCGSAASETADPRIVQLRVSAAGSDSNTVLAAALAGGGAAQSSIMFDGLGRVTPLPAADIQIDVSNDIPGGSCIVSGGKNRCLRISVSAGGQIRMCDSALPAGSTQAC